MSLYCHLLLHKISIPLSSKRINYKAQRKKNNKKKYNFVEGCLQKFIITYKDTRNPCLQCKKITHHKAELIWHSFETGEQLSEANIQHKLYFIISSTQFLDVLFLLK